MRPDPGAVNRQTGGPGARAWRRGAPSPVAMTCGPEPEALGGLWVTAVTWNPAAFAYWIARCPRPPTPDTAIRAPGLGLGPAQAAPHRVAGADDGRGLLVGHPVGNEDRPAGVDRDVLGVGSVDGDPGQCRAGAVRCGDEAVRVLLVAEVADPAHLLRHEDPDTVADLALRNTLTDGDGRRRTIPWILGHPAR
jgi:hypothetical protein